MRHQLTGQRSLTARSRLPAEDVARLGGSSSVSEFRRGYLRPRKPVVLDGDIFEVANDGRWELSELSSRYGEVPVRLQDTRVVPFKDALQAINLGGESASAYALRNVPLSSLEPGLSSTLPVVPFFEPNCLRAPLLTPGLGSHPRDWYELFVSPAAVSHTCVHFDGGMTHAWSAQVTGNKRFYLWPPFQGQPRDSVHIHRYPTEDGFEELFGHAYPSEVVIRPGEVLFVPAGWWHTTFTESQSVTISGNFVSWWNLGSYYRAMAEGSGGRTTTRGFHRCMSGLTSLAERLPVRSRASGFR
jgi:histone arginine demethylase JMJD6